MTLKAKKPLTQNDVTPYSDYKNRRQFIKETALDFAKLSAGVSIGSSIISPAIATGEVLKPTPYRHATGYNNFYEFSTDKRGPAELSKDFNTDNWKIEVAGHCAKVGTYDLEKIIKLAQAEERIYRFRCVEAWSMVIPWNGVSLASILKAFEPTVKAKYVAFTTLLDEEQFPNQKSNVLPWPYRDGLRMDEAMNPLSFLATGMYGKDIPSQNGAPVRLVVPWKYGFKNIKSIVKIEFTEKEPACTWNQLAPNEYGFYANVNPNVDHPRWSQARERVIGAGAFSNRRATEIFNGYSDEVAHMYTGMDLSKYY